MAEPHTTDDNCMRYCRCPECGGPAHWSLPTKWHACADPECAVQFQEHDDEQFSAQADKDMSHE